MVEDNHKETEKGPAPENKGPGPEKMNGVEGPPEKVDEKKAVDTGGVGGTAPPSQAPAPGTQVRPMAAGRSFLGTTRGKVVVLVLVVIIVGAALFGTGAFRFSATVKTSVKTAAENVTVPDNYYAEKTLTFSYGHRRAPVGTSQTVTFPVEGNATDGLVETTGDPGAIPRYDRGDRKEVDIEVLGASGKTIGSSATPSIHEVVKLDAKKLQIGGIGEWQVVVDCYSGTNVVVTLKIWVNYTKTNATGNGTSNSTLGPGPTPLGQGTANENHDAEPMLSSAEREVWTIPNDP